MCRELWAGKKLLGRTRHKWEGNVKMDLKEVIEVVEWLCLA